MKKIKGLFVVLVIIGIVVTFFSGFAQATKVLGVNKFIGHVFIDGGKDTKFIMGAEKCFFSPSKKQFINRSIQKTQTLEGIVEVNRKLAKNGQKGKKKKDSGKKYWKYRKGRGGGDDEVVETVIIEKEEKSKEEKEKEREQEEKKKEEEEKRQEEERKRKEEKIKNEDWFR
jgi:hypothetical protein